MSLSPEGLAVGVTQLTPDAFMDDGHRVVFCALVKLHAQGKPPDLILLRNELERAGKLEDAGGVDYLVSLAEGVPSHVNAPYYAAIVNRKYQLRKLLVAALLMEARTQEIDADPATIARESRDAICGIVDAGSQRTRFLTADEIKTRPAPTWLIEGMIPRGSFAVLYGPSGCSKSFLALDWGLSVSSGVSWMGRKVDVGSVVYVAAEGSSGLGQRIRAWESEHGTTANDKMKFVCDAVAMNDTEAVSAILSEIRSLPAPPALIVVDTLARCLVGGDENSAQDMGLFVGGIDRLRSETGAAVLVIHHTGKNTEAGARGSSALYAAADAVMRIDPDGDTFTVKCDKLKDSSDFAPLALVRIAVNVSATETSCVIGTVTERDGNWTESMRLAHKTVTEISTRDGITYTQWLTASGMSEKSFLRARKALVETGYVQEVRAGGCKRYRPTDSALPSYRHDTVIPAMTVNPLPDSHVTPLIRGDGDCHGDGGGKAGHVPEGMLDDEPERIPTGIPPKLWARQLRGKADRYEADNPETAADYRRRADQIDGGERPDVAEVAADAD